jgi:hypothetical protein
MTFVTDAAKNLPSDPDVALVTFADKINKYYESMQGILEDDDAIFVIRFVRLFTKKFGVSVAIEYPNDGSPDEQAMAIIEQILEAKPNLVAKKVDEEVEALLAEYSTTQNDTFGLARLNDEEKKKILHGLEKIRQIIEVSDLSDRKKNALFERLTDLIREVNTHGTRTDRFFAFAGDVGFVLGDMTKRAKPLVDEVKEVLRVLSRSRARQEGISLPPGDEVLRIAPPEEPLVGE